ncbi:MAG TPA: phosphoglucosamine mutase [Bryobacteraceae bacterium]|nr:phosphoglucosamine mutase [Bryobacteraceae bacterium]
MARSLFGTDGIRGVAGVAPLDHKTARAVGAALGQWVIESKRNRADPSAQVVIGQVVIGMDTRESGPWLAAEVASGLAWRGVKAEFAGVTTTPGVAYLAKNGPFAAGVMISASHNPYQDNGIKLLGHAGYKLPDDQEERLETEIFRLLEQGLDLAPSKLTVNAGLDRAYTDHLAATLPGGLGGLRLVVDCANGSASKLAPELFTRLGAEVHPIHCAPDGRNINLNCGSLHLDVLQSAVLAQKADAGVAFDGDADRALFVARSGKIIDGDAVLFLMARYLKAPLVVATVMSNLGLEIALRKHGIAMLRTPVGDKYVLEEMLRQNAALGGEQSGHVIFHQYATTGDGMLTALRVFEVMRASGSGLDELTAELQVYPQRLVNVRVRERKSLAEMPAVISEIRAAEKSFGDTGRVVVRFSGTEPLARVMVEGPDLERVETAAQRIADRIRSELGGEESAQTFR